MAKSSKQQILSVNDLSIVLTELHPARSKWYNIGLQLLVPVPDLQRIESEYKNDHGTCLRQMLIKWLEMETATWETLIEALKSPIVQGDENMALAANLQKKYCGKEEESHGKGKKRKIGETKAPGPGGAPPTKKARGDLPITIDPDNFVNAPAEDRLCAKCRQVPTNPQISQCCGTVYCQSCSSTKTYCLTHHCAINYTDDKKLKTKIMDLRCRCPNWRGGCQFKEGVSKVYRQHLPDCQIRVQGGDSGGHGSSTPAAMPTSFTVSTPPIKTEPGPSCSARLPVTPTPRPFTGAVGSGKSGKTGKSGEPSSAKFGGKSHSKPSMVKSITEVKCKYHRIGCPRTFPSYRMMEQHLLEDVQHHLDLAIGKIEQHMDILHQ